MGSILSNPAIKDAIQQIAVKTEREEPQAAINSFYDCNIISHLTNVNHQIIQGRRGTGKTHILFVLKNKLETSERHCIYFDCRTTGSAADISDTALPENHRVIQLIRDFLLYLHKDFLGYFNDILCSDTDERKIELKSLLNQLHEECYTNGRTIERYEQSQNKKIKATRATSDGAKFTLSSVLAASMEYLENRQREHESTAGYDTSGTPYKKVVFPNIFQCIDRLAEISEKKFVILIDEWSNLPMDIQPHFAEFLRKCLLPSRHVTIKIAVVRGRTQYCTKKNNVRYGFEIGADISVAIDLDSVYMYDKDPRKVFSNLYRILWTHLKAKGVMDIGADAFLETLFQDFKSAVLLVRASEGNPRDFISIVTSCIVALDGIGSSGTWIDSQTVYRAANDWYSMDKEEALSPQQKQLLSEITKYVAHENGTRGFVLDECYLDNSAIKGLIDARILHVAQTGRHFANYGDRSMAIVILDFGAYANLMMTGQKIFFFTNDPFEAQIFPRRERSAYDEAQHPLHRFDQTRLFQVCFFDPVLKPNICPSFSSFK